ncbi:hypothetical protein KJ365_07625 [Glaciecola sp. XM2]|jgi:hypothetical protein|uniref:hypothetical protein n=1 Tax=Glaciecola sp. XM2 TaxID=1914931 RepID=UPI001BDE7E1F|nr:hypothetical protein [Glaciecola sp. XM2]MBT1450751.1 hypothetical protein [Glaciecola sp. XM2]
MDLTAIIIVAIISGTIVSIIKVFKQQSTKEAKTGSKFKEHEQNVQQKINELQERVAVLEKIVTEDKYSLNKAFSDLKD